MATTKLTLSLIDETVTDFLDFYSTEDYRSWSYEEMAQMIKEYLLECEDVLSEEDFDRLFDLVEDAFLNRESEEDERYRQELFEEDYRYASKQDLAYLMYN